MDLLGLLTLLQTECLHFTHLQDLYRFDADEGTGGLSIQVVNDPIQASGWSSDPTAEEEQRNANEIASIKEKLSIPFSDRLPHWRQQIETWDRENENVQICCWHANDLESDFMWRIYGKEQYGFAIVSSAQTFFKCFGGIGIPKIGAGFVVYPTADNLIRWDLHSYMGSDSAFMIKHVECAHENEFRVFVRTRKRARGCDLKVNLKLLVQQIRISPLVPEWAEMALLATLNPICEAKGIPQIERRFRLRSVAVGSVGAGNVANV